MRVQAMLVHARCARKLAFVTDPSIPPARPSSLCCRPNATWSRRNLFLRLALYGRRSPRPSHQCGRASGVCQCYIARRARVQNRLCGLPVGANGGHTEIFGHVPADALPLAGRWIEKPDVLSSGAFCDRESPLRIRRVDAQINNKARIAAQQPRIVLAPVRAAVRRGSHVTVCGCCIHCLAVGGRDRQRRDVRWVLPGSDF